MDGEAADQSLDVAGLPDGDEQDSGRGPVRDEFVDGAAPPASTAVEVSSLALPGMTIEVDAIAVV